MPKVSVLMPVYKTAETYLREAIESILAQTLKLFNTFPFIRIRYYNNTKRKIYLFGIPLLTIKGE